MHKIKILTFYTESHNQIYNDYFLSSLSEKISSEKFDLIPFFGKQLSNSGSYNTPGFEETMFYKIDHIIKNIDTDSSDLLVFSDCDVQFLNDFTERAQTDMMNFDILFQDDITCACAGFFIAKQTREVLDFFIQVRSIMYMNLGKDGKLASGMSDQSIINLLIRQNKVIKTGLLPRDVYFTIASSTGPKQWMGEDFNIPFNIHVHHANWTVGIENKIRLMEMVKLKYESNRISN